MSAHAVSLRLAVGAALALLAGGAHAAPMAFEATLEIELGGSGVVTVAHLPSDPGRTADLLPSGALAVPPLPLAGSVALAHGDAALSDAMLTVTGADGGTLSPSTETWRGRLRVRGALLFRVAGGGPMLTLGSAIGTPAVSALRTLSTTTGTTPSPSVLPGTTGLGLSASFSPWTAGTTPISSEQTAGGIHQITPRVVSGSILPPTGAPTSLHLVSPLHVNRALVDPVGGRLRTLAGAAHMRITLVPEPALGLQLLVPAGLLAATGWRRARSRAASC